MISSLISLFVGVVTYVSIIVTMKNKGDVNQKDIEKAQENHDTYKIANEKIHSKMFDKIDELNTEIAEHKVRLGNAPNMEQVRAEFVSKEMFKQMEKHIDEKFDKLENGIEKILDKKKKKNN